MPQLYVQPATEQLFEPRETLDRLREVTGGCGPRDRPLPAPGECDDVGVTRQFDEVTPAIDGPVFLPSELAARDELRQRSVCTGRAGQEDQMVGLFPVDRLGSV